MKLSNKGNPKFWQDNGIWMSSQVQKELREAYTHRRSKTKINENLMKALHGLDDALLSIGEVQKDSKADLKKGKVDRSSRRQRRAAERKSETAGALKGQERMPGVVEKDKEDVEKIER